MKRKKGTLLILGGLLLIVAALFLTVYNLWENNSAEKSVKKTIEILEETIVSENVNEETESEEIPDYILDPEMNMPELEIDGHKYIGYLEIPSQSLKLSVISEWSYPALKIAPCRYSGSVYMNNLVIAAHNYRSHFGNLKNFTGGEEIIFTDVDGNKFYYTVVLCEILQPTEVEEMKAEEWDLTLFTCTYGGGQRVTIRCERTDEVSVF